MTFEFPRATKEQVKYIEILFIDILGANNTRAERLSFMRLRTRNNVNYPDDLTMQEASDLIEKMKGVKEEKRATQKPIRKMANSHRPDSDSEDS